MTEEQSRLNNLRNTVAQTEVPNQGVVLKQESSYNPKSVDGTPAQQPKSSKAPKRKEHDEDEVLAKDNSKLLIIIFLALVVVIVAIVIALKFTGGSTEDNSLVKESEGDMSSIEYIEPVFAYTEDEIALLRTVGYTGTEIEENQANGISAQSLIDTATAEQEAWIQEFVAPLYDTASEDYKQNLQSTWLGLTERFDVAEYLDSIVQQSVTRNLDFEKITVQGNQIFLKIYLDANSHDDYFFMSVTPKRYLELPDSGNIVVVYEYLPKMVMAADGVTYEEDHNQIFIISAHEQIVEE